MNYNTHSKYLQAVPLLKFLLIIGVFIIHSNILICADPSAHNRTGPEIVGSLVSCMYVCVPSFFIISGYLFFYDVKNFSFGIYKEKLLRRVKTLLIPYLMWNLFCAVLFLFKVLVLHHHGMGIVENGEINWGKFLEGFIFISEYHNQPYDFALWFIRDLMVFMVLTPAVWVIARKWWAVAAVFAVVYGFRLNIYYMEWFILGASLSLHKISLDNIKPDKIIISTTAFIYLLVIIVRRQLEPQEILETSLSAIGIVSAFFFLYTVSSLIIRKHNGRIMKLLCSSTFFIYAFHACFSSVNIAFWKKIFNYDTVLSSLASFLATFITLIIVSLATYILLRKYCPRFLNILSGERS